MSFLDTLKAKFQKKDDRAVYLSGFAKSKNKFGDQLQQMQYKYKGYIDENFLEELTIVLLESDVGIDTADLICEELRGRGRNTARSRSPGA